MNSHTQLGCKMIDELLENFGLSGIGQINMLRNIAEFHHESINGRGYPLGIQGEEIPLEARIVAVADVFDALTSKRPYKDAWSNVDAVQELIKLAGEKLDQECVEALIHNLEEVEKIQQQFKENRFV